MKHQWSSICYDYYTDSRKENNSNKDNSQLTRQIDKAKNLDSSIGSDVQYLREQAKGTIKEYVTDHLPEQYQVCLCALRNTCL